MAPPTYLTVNEFKDLTVAPAFYVDEIEAAESGWTEKQLASWSRYIDARLSKRYSTPFGSPYPGAVKGWLSRLVTLRVYYKRGIDPTDAQFEAVSRDSDAVVEELREAADSKEGLFGLPLREDDQSSGITKGAPLHYVEQSPYQWPSLQRDADPTRSG